MYYSEIMDSPEGNWDLYLAVRTILGERWLTFSVADEQWYDKSYLLHHRTQRGLDDENADAGKKESAIPCARKSM